MQMDGSMGRWRRPLGLVAEAAHMADLCVGLCWLLLFAVHPSLPRALPASPVLRRLCVSPLPMNIDPAAADDEHPDEKVDDEEVDEYDGGRWSMYSSAGDDEVSAILSAATTWAELAQMMQAAVHQEINDTAVRDRLYEAFEDRLACREDDGGAPFVSYAEYCAERRQREEAARAEQDAWLQNENARLAASQAATAAANNATATEPREKHDNHKQYKRLGRQHPA